MQPMSAKARRQDEAKEASGSPGLFDPLDAQQNALNNSFHPKMAPLHLNQSPMQNAVEEVDAEFKT